MHQSDDQTQFANSQFTSAQFAGSHFAGASDDAPHWLLDEPWSLAAAAEAEFPPVAAKPTVQAIAKDTTRAADPATGEEKGRDRDSILLEHLATVRSVAHRIHERLPEHVELDDLISAGVIGLIDAFNKFDHSKQVQFKSYAQFRIRGAILDSLRVLDWSPRELRRKGRAVQDAILALTRSLQRVPTEPEIARELNLDLNEYQLLLGQLKGLEIGSLNLENNEDSGEEQLDCIPGSAQDDPLFRCLQGEMRQRLRDAIEELPEKERMVLTLYYFEEITMKEIGMALGVVESRVSQIRSAAVRRLRSRFHVPQRSVPRRAGLRHGLSAPCDC